MKINVLAYPKDPNPYQELLYSHMNESVNIFYLRGPTSSQSINNILLPYQLFIYRIKGFKIFHLHWTYNFQTPINNRLIRAIYTIYFLIIIKLIKLLGYKLIWTVHNVLPGEKRFTKEVSTRNILSKLCDSKIIHSQSTIEEMISLGIDTKCCYIIPHGNYINFYKNNVTESDARKYFNYKENDLVLLFFGNINPYKGIYNLLDAFKKLKNKKRNIQLLIGGKCNDENLKKVLEKFKREFNNNVQLYNQFIENDKVQYFFRSADIVVYPFRKITSSGSVLLGLSFGKPVICPKIGNLIDLPNNVGIFYEPKHKDGLSQAMNLALINISDLATMEENAYNYVKGLSWNTIANRTYEVYKKVLLE